MTVPFLQMSVGPAAAPAGRRSLVADKLYVLSAAELKRAKITRVQLGGIAAALDTDGSAGGVPEWEQFEAIERGEYTDARRRKAKTAADRAQWGDEWLPVVECQPCHVPPGAGRGARGAGLRAGPPGASGPAGKGGRRGTYS